VFTGRLRPGGLTLGTIDPLILAQSRTTLSFLVLLPVLLWQRGPAELRLPRRELLHVFLLGVLGVASSNYFYYLAIQKTNVATAIILQYTAPIWVLLYMVAKGLQKPTLQRVSAVALAVAGSTLAIGLVGAGGFRINVVANSGSACGIFICFLQHRRAPHPRPLRSLESAGIHVGKCRSLLADREPSMENCGRALWTRRMVVSADLRDHIGVVAVLPILRRTPAPRRDQRHRRELPGASILHPDRRSRVG
jgi:uncharacterized membrane protein